MPRNSKNQKKLLMIITALVWAAAIATSAGKFKLAAKSPITIELTTKPSFVKVTINGEKHFEGVYIDTPRQIRIAGGVNRITISREGYISNLFSVDAASGETVSMNEVVLQKNPELMFQTLEINHDDRQDPIYVSVANGFIVGETPIATDDAVQGSTYIITAFPAWPDRGVQVRCRVKMPVSHSNDYESDTLTVHKVSIRKSRRGDTLFFKGCAKLK